jgi:hypothetical protein
MLINEIANANANAVAKTMNCNLNINQYNDLLFSTLYQYCPILP